MCLGRGLICQNYFPVQGLMLIYVAYLAEILIGYKNIARADSQISFRLIQ